VFCVLCEGGPTYYFRESRARCEECRQQPLKLLLGLIFGLGGAVAALVVWWRWVRNAHRDWWRSRVDALARSLQHLRTGRPAFKVVFSFYQIVAVLGEVYNVTFPSSYRNILSVLQIVTLKLTAWLPVLPLECAFPSLRGQLLFVMLAPLAVIAVAIAIGAGLALRTQPRGSASAASLLLPSLPFVLIWAFIIFPPVSSLGFRALAPCECFEYDVTPPGDESRICFLSTDRNVQCVDSSFGYRAPTPILVAASFTIIIWAGGVPLLYGALMYAARHPLALRSPPTPLSKTLVFLTDGFRPATFWWEVPANEIRTNPLEPPPAA
jgi:hypothetical protein